LRDLGKVEDDIEEARTHASVDGKPAILMDIRRQSGTNTVKIIDSIRAKLSQIEKELPPGFRMRVTRDQSVFIRASIESLMEHLLLGSLLAALIVWVFIRNLRSVFIAAVAIPTSIIATFTLMKALDFTLNNMTLLMVPSAKLSQTRLDNLATIARGTGPARIERANRQFQVGLNSNLKPGVSLDEGARQTTEAISRVTLPEGYRFRFFGQVKVLEETTANLIITFLLASIFMYMVLAAQFESILHPLIIMLSLPLSIPFALFSLWATGRSLNLWSALGMLLLLGIVKKNAILQIDYTNQLRREGLPLREAIVRANHVRLRPILMTTFSIVAGLIPTAVGIGAGAAQRSAIAVTIISGQTLCLLLTLLVTPVAYSLLSGFENMSVFSKVGSGLAAAKANVTRMFS